MKTTLRISQDGKPHFKPGVQVLDQAVVSSTAQVHFPAQVANQAQVYGDAEVLEHAQVLDRAILYDSVEISGHAVIRDHASVYDYAIVGDQATISGQAEVYGTSWVCDQATISGQANVSGDSLIEGHATIEGHAKVIDSLVKDAVVTGNASIQRAHLYGGHWDGSEGVIHGGSWLAPGISAKTDPKNACRSNSAISTPPNQPESLSSGSTLPETP